MATFFFRNKWKYSTEPTTCAIGFSESDAPFADTVAGKRMPTQKSKHWGWLVEMKADRGCGFYCSVTFVRVWRSNVTVWLKLLQCHEWPYPSLFFFLCFVPLLLCLPLWSPLFSVSLSLPQRTQRPDSIFILSESGSSSTGRFTYWWHVQSSRSGRPGLIYSTPTPACLFTTSIHLCTD